MSRTDTPVTGSDEQATSEAMILRRDLWGRRIWKEWRERAARLIGLCGLDMAVAYGAWTLAAPVAVRGETAALATPIAVLAAVASLGVMGTYGRQRLRRNFERVIAAVLLSVVALFTISAATGSPAFGHAGNLCAFGLLASVGVILGRRASEVIVRRLHAAGFARKRTLLIGSDEEAWTIIGQFRERGERSLNIIGHLTPSDQQDPAALGTTSELASLIEEYDVQHVFVAPNVSSERNVAIARECLLHGATVGLYTEIGDISPLSVNHRDVVGWPSAQLRIGRIQLTQVAAKRLIDLVVSSALLIVGAPIMACIAVCVRLESPGRAFFVQRRPGLGGRPFHMLKFRSMRSDAEHVLRDNEELYQRFLANGCKLPPGEDPRISRVGRFIRSTSLDELPQLINVFRGEMSLVGPRPVVGPELEAFGPLADVVLSVKPGMTGLWQISGRSTIGPAARAVLDVEYVWSWTLRRDLGILMRTLPVVLRRAGAH